MQLHLFGLSGNILWLNWDALQHWPLHCCPTPDRGNGPTVGREEFEESFSPRTIFRFASPCNFAVSSKAESGSCHAYLDSKRHRYIWLCTSSQRVLRPWERRPILSTLSTWRRISLRATSCCWLCLYLLSQPGSSREQC